MDTYQTVAQSVLDYLYDHQYCSSLIKANKRCFEKLRVYLEEKNISYSPEAALEWFTQANDLAPSDINHLSRYLGHKSTNETFYYYYLVKEAYKTIEKKDTIADDVIPEVTSYE